MPDTPLLGRPEDGEHLAKQGFGLTDEEISQADNPESDIRKCIDAAHRMAVREVMARPDRSDARRELMRIAAKQGPPVARREALACLLELGSSDDQSDRTQTANALRAYVGDAPSDPLRAELAFAAHQLEHFASESGSGTRLEEVESREQADPRIAEIRAIAREDDREVARSKLLGWVRSERWRDAKFNSLRRAALETLIELGAADTQAQRQNTIGRLRNYAADMPDDDLSGEIVAAADEIIALYVRERNQRTWGERTASALVPAPILWPLLSVGIALLIAALLVRVVGPIAMFAAVPAWWLSMLLFTDLFRRG